MKYNNGITTLLLFFLSYQDNETSAKGLATTDNKGLLIFSSLAPNLRAMNTNPKVDEYLEKKAHPMDAEIRRVREIILATDPAMEETIKWSSPTFMYKGNMASFFMNAKKFVSLMFHKGAVLPNASELLSGDGKEGRVARFESLEDIENKKEALESVVKEWMTYTART